MMVPIKQTIRPNWAVSYKWIPDPDPNVYDDTGFEPGSLTTSWLLVVQRTEGVTHARREYCGQHLFSVGETPSIHEVRGYAVDMLVNLGFNRGDAEEIVRSIT